MKRFAVFDSYDRFLRRVFAFTPDEALAKVKKLPGGLEAAWVKEEPMAQVTRGD